MHKKLLFIALAWLCAITGMADTLTILNRFEKIEHASVLASYRNEFGSYRKPDMDVEFPYALIRVHIEGNELAVTKAKERFALYLGQHYTTKAKNTSRVNEIMFLVPIGAGHVELQCGDGCQPLTLFDYSQLTADAIYEGKVRYAMDAAVQPDPTPVSRQFFKFRVSPADAMVEVDENGKKEIWKVVDGVARKALYHGNYAYSVSANRYHTQEGVITVSDANTETTIALKPRFGWLSITGGSEANGASVYATNTTTGVRQSLGTIPLTKVELDPGEYSLLILQDQYKDYSSSIQISENNETSIRASLAPNFARVTLRAAAGNEILIDEQKKGTGSWTGTLELGDYVVETRQAGHRAAYTSIAVTASSEGKTITLNQPTPIYGSLMVDGLPADATVYVDGVKKGLTPMIVNQLLIGSHQVRIEKEGYAKQEKTVTITEGQEAVMDYALTKEEVKSTPASASAGEHEYVDLGLSVKWATCNVGATKPEEYGDYFACGETEPKEVYDWSTYKWCNGSETTLTKYCTSSSYGAVDNKKTLELSDDAAAVNWGGNWRMPTKAEQDELRKQCTWTWTTQNGVKGYKVTSKSNGKSIFLPAAGYRYRSSLNNAGSDGGYWSSSLYTDYANYAYNLGFGSSNVGWDDTRRYCGLSVRPVYGAQGEQVMETFTVNGVSFKMIKVDGGTFTMGATSEQGTSDPYDDEYPTHSVTLSDFSIGETEVTQELWQAVMGSNPSSFSGTNLPVEKVSWNDCQTFITKLNKLTGKTFRLPTEAEWEYAARGGNKSKGYKYAGSNTLSDVAWYIDNSSSKTHPVKQKQANELGLYDMSGNIWEWCQDWYGSYSSSWQTNPKGPSSGSHRVRRGGSCGDSAWCWRVSYRSSTSPTSTYYNLGLRLAL